MHSLISTSENHSQDLTLLQYRYRAFTTVVYNTGLAQARKQGFTGRSPSHTQYQFLPVVTVTDYYSVLSYLLSYGYPVYPVLDSVTPLGDQAVLSTYLLVTTTNQPIIASTAMLLLMCYDSTIIVTHRAPIHRLLLAYISILHLRLLQMFTTHSIHIRAIYQFAYVYYLWLNKHYTCILISTTLIFKHYTWIMISSTLVII